MFLNGEKLAIETFEDYIDLYMDNCVYIQMGENWEIGVGQSEAGKFQQVSLVNSIATIKGGTHVDCMLGKLLAKKSNKVSLDEIRHRLHLNLFIQKFDSSLFFFSAKTEAEEKNGIVRQLQIARNTFRCHEE